MSLDRTDELYIVIDVARIVETLHVYVIESNGRIVFMLHALLNVWCGRTLLTYPTDL